MKKEPWPFLFKLIISSLVLGYIWFDFAQDAYPVFLKPIVFPFFKWVGVKKWRLSFLLDHFTNIIPYLALVIATPGFFKNWKRTLIAGFGGLIILIIGHLLISWIDYHYWSQAQFKLTRGFFKNTFYIYMLNDALPLGIWLLFYPQILSQIFKFLKFGRKEEAVDSS